MGVARGNLNAILDLETSCQPSRAGERGRNPIYRSWEGNFCCNIMTQEQTFKRLMEKASGESRRTGMLLRCLRSWFIYWPERHGPPAPPCRWQTPLWPTQLTWWVLFGKHLLLKTAFWEEGVYISWFYKPSARGIIDKFLLRCLTFLIVSKSHIVCLISHFYPVFRTGNSYLSYPSWVLERG